MDTRVKEIDEYLAGLPVAQQTALRRLRMLLHSAVPGAEEIIKTRVPAVLYKGKTVAGFGAAARHVALYVMFGEALSALKDELADFDATTRVVRFSPSRPVPAVLVRKILRFRLAEIDAQLDQRRSRK
jgi:uncharacterized protein YdhG (YjbR/CyaY superfamily)